MNRRTVTALVINDLRQLARNPRVLVFAVALPLVLWPLMWFLTSLTTERRQERIESRTYTYAVADETADVAGSRRRAGMARAGAGRHWRRRPCRRRRTDRRSGGSLRAGRSPGRHRGRARRRATPRSRGLGARSHRRLPRRRRRPGDGRKRRGERTAHRPLAPWGSRRLGLRRGVSEAGARAHPNRSPRTTARGHRLCVGRRTICCRSNGSRPPARSRPPVSSSDAS